MAQEKQMLVKVASLITALLVLRVDGGISQSEVRRAHWFPQSEPKLPPLSRHRHYSSVTTTGGLILPPAFVLHLRGGYEEEQTLDQRVEAAMLKMGLKGETSSDSPQCEDGVCKIPETTSASSTSTSAAAVVENSDEKEADVHEIAERISESMNVDKSLAMAALGATSTVEPGKARQYNEEMARDLIQQELNIIAQVPEDSESVQQLVSEGFDPFLSRRALAFAELKMEDARAILLADQMDAEEEEKAKENQEANTQASTTESPEKKKMFWENDGETDAKKTQEPANVPETTNTAAQPVPDNIPEPAKKSDVVFEAEASQIQELVLESPVPVLLDIYADWCGPCKQLTPMLEEMAIKGGGAFRLVKVNSDKEKAVSAALEITALPTILGFRDGKLLNVCQGMPKSQQMWQNFMMGLLVPDMDFDPPLTSKEKETFKNLSSKLVKVAGGASFSFSARERLQDRVMSKLNDFIKETGDFVDAEASATTLRSLLSNVIQNPYDVKYRTVNLSNKVINAKVAKVPACASILKYVGFVPNSSGQFMTLGQGKSIVNVAPLTVARDCIDKWIDKSRYEVAKASRKRKDEADRAELLAKAAEAGDDDIEEEEEPEEEVDPNLCSLKLRIDGKKKVHDIALDADDALSVILEKLPVSVDSDEEIQITCIAKRLVVKSSDKARMSQTLREHGLHPKASIVVKVGEAQGASDGSSKNSLAERALAKKNLKKGSHTMQSTGIYAKDDNLKGELVDGGGGTLYEHDVSDDEDKEADEEAQEEQSEDTDEQSEDTDKKTDSEDA